MSRVSKRVRDDGMSPLAQCCAASGHLDGRQLGRLLCVLQADGKGGVRVSGTLLIVGGALEDSEAEVLGELVERAGGRHAKYAVIVAASGSDPDKAFSETVRSFGRVGVPRENCILIPLYPPGVTDKAGSGVHSGDDQCLPPLFSGVTGVWFTGGDQRRIVQCLLRPDGTRTTTLQVLHRIYRDGGAIGGTSAGAAIMSRAMIGGGDNLGVMTKDPVFAYEGYDDTGRPPPVLIASGLGFFTEGIVDQHFNARPRMLRAIEAALSNREGARIAFGVSEDTAMVYRDGCFHVLGSGGVYVLDCRGAQKRARGSYEGVMVHALHRGDSFDIGERAATFAREPEGRRTRHVAKDYVNGATIDNPLFGSFVRSHLLGARDDCLFFCPKRNKRYAKGISVHEIGAKTLAVVLAYFRDGTTRGYWAGTTSFTGVELAVYTTEIEGLVSPLTPRPNGGNDRDN